MTDPTLTDTELFYLSTDMTTEDRLVFYTEHFPHCRGRRHLLRPALDYGIRSAKTLGELLD